MEITIDVKNIYGDVAKISENSKYQREVLEIAGNGNDVVLTGPGPVWLYLLLAHALHGKCRSLYYDSPVTGKMIIFNHNPY